MLHAEGTVTNDFEKAKPQFLVWENTFMFSFLAGVSQNACNSIVLNVAAASPVLHFLGPVKSVALAEQLLDP